MAKLAIADGSQCCWRPPNSWSPRSEGDDSVIARPLNEVTIDGDSDPEFSDLHSSDAATFGETIPPLPVSRLILAAGERVPSAGASHGKRPVAAGMGSLLGWGGGGVTFPRWDQGGQGDDVAVPADSFQSSQDDDVRG